MPENNGDLIYSINSLSFNEIQKLADTLQTETDGAWIDLLINDPRKSVSMLGRRLLKKKEDLVYERNRLANMRIYENKYVKFITGGFDEAGRGPLAGPVVAAIVILPVDCEILYLNDSKKINADKREQLYAEIIDKAIDWSVGIIDNNIIDEINILNATHRAAVAAYENLNKVKPQVLLTDALKIKGMPENIKQEPIIKGDMKSVNIAAASIIAKVTRDRVMLKAADKYTEYNFEKNKGYGASEHIDAIKKNGLCPLHRKTFCKNFF